MAKFNEETCKCLVELYADGIPLKYCADAVGINRSTIYDWMDKGAKAKSGKYKKFYLDMQKAKAKFIQKNVKEIQDNKSWMAKQYLLQVTDPETYVVEKKVNAGLDVKTNFDELFNEEDIKRFIDESEYLKEGD